MSMQAQVQQGTNEPASNANGTHGSKMKLVYVVVDRPGRSSIWTRVGAAFVNRDGSLSVRLDAVPMSGNLQIRDWVPRDDQAAHAPGGASAAVSGLLSARDRGFGGGFDTSAAEAEASF